MSNPYITGIPVTGEKFFNREKIISELLEFDGSSYFLNGLRRIGKTSILRKIEENLGGDSTILPIYLSLAGHENSIEMGKELSREITKSMSEKMDSALVFEGFNQFEDVLRKWLSYCDNQQKNSYLLIDECEQFQFLDEKSLLTIYNLFLESKGILKVIVAGTRKFLNDTRPAFDTFQGFFSKKYVGHFEPNHAEALINQSNLTAVGNPFSQEVMVNIVKKCGGHPFLIQTVCGKLFQTDGKSDIGTFAIDRSLDIFFKIDFDSLSEIQRIILDFITFSGESDKNTIQKTCRINEPTFNREMVELRDLGMVSDIGGKWRISYGLLAEWIASQDIVKVAEDDARYKIVTLFAPAAHTYVQELKTQCLNLLHRYFEDWNINDILTENVEEITLLKLSEADIVISLLTPDFFTPDSATERLFVQVKAHKRFIPIIATAFDYEEVLSPTEYQILPQHQAQVRPLQSWEFSGEAYQQISKKLKDIRNEITQQRTK